MTSYERRKRKIQAQKEFIEAIWAPPKKKYKTSGLMVYANIDPATGKKYEIRRRKR